MPDKIKEIKKEALMGRTCMKKIGYFSANGSMWDSARKETVGKTTTKIGGQKPGNMYKWWI